MKDGIIKGQGNSRLLKAPETIPATFAEFRAALINGTLPVDVLFNAVGWDVAGTPLNKASLLTDTVAAALGLESSDPTVNEAINALMAVATQAKNGMMSAVDKGKLDGVENNANNYVHPTTAGNKHIPSGGSVDSILGYSASGLAIWIQQLALKSLLSAGTAAMYGLSGADANVDKALTITRNPTYEVILASDLTDSSYGADHRDILSLTLPAGKYLMLAAISFQTTMCVMYIDVNGTALGYTRYNGVISPNGMNIQRVINLAGTTTVKLRGMFNTSSGGKVNASYTSYTIAVSDATRLTAIKLA